LGSFASPASSRASATFVEGTDSAAAIFDPMKVNNFSLQMSASDFDSLRYPNVTWDNEGPWRETQMTFTMAGKVYGPYTVGVHLKGAHGSWHDVDGRNRDGIAVGGKPAFKIKMNEFVRGQTLFGIKRFTLNNMVQDRSSVREVITYHLYRKLGIPSPRTGYANVSLNGINYGLHLNVETLNKQLIERWGHSSARLYKGGVPWFPDLVRGSESMFDLDSGDKSDTSELSNFMAINELSGKAWFDAISARMDMELLAVSWASELYSGHWDGYMRHLNNYYINFDNNGKAMLLPWGVDSTWGSPWNYFEARAVMPNKCWEYAPCLELYKQSLAKVSRVARELNLTSMVTTVATAIRPSIENDPLGYGWSTAKVEQDFTVLRLNEQQSHLSEMVIPFDTTLQSFRVNGTRYGPSQTVKLPAGTKNVKLQVSTSQSTAKAVIQKMAILKPGLNKAFVVVTSSNNQHVNTTAINLYVYKTVNLRREITFHKDKSLPTIAGESNIGILGTGLTGAANPVLDIKMAKLKSTSTSKAKTLMANRVRHLLKALASRGIKPQKVTQTIVSSGSTNTLQVTASYQK
jgi:hypothetical protein